MASNKPEEGIPSGHSSSVLKDDLALHVLHSLDQPISILDAEDTYLFVNQSYARLHGKRPDSMRGQSVREQIGAEFYDKQVKVLLERARNEGSARYSGWVEYHELGRRFVEVDIRSYAYPGLVGRQCLMLQHKDVTERVELDQRRKKSLDYQEKLMGDTPAMVWISGKDLQPYFYNESWLNFTGCTSMEQVREGWKNWIHPDDRSEVMDRLSFANDNDDSVDIEFRMLYMMGGYRWVRLSGKSINRGNGEKGNFIVSVLDIHDLKLREQQLKTALEEAEYLREQALKQKSEADRANREKSAYLSLASHEIRTPMNPIIGFADLLASNPDLDADSKEMAQMILKAGKNLLTLIDEILDFAKIESGVLELTPEPVDTHDLLMEIENLYLFDAKSRGIDLKITDRITSKEQLYEDRLRLQQILGSLLANAVKFTHTGEVELIASSEIIDLEGKRAEMLKFIIRDTGIGMDQDEIERLFKPFSKADNEIAEKYSGSGLGLAITQKLIEAMNGRIVVDSEIDRGTTVELVIPFTPVPEHLRPALKRHDTEQVKEIEDKEGRASILIVDDEQSCRQVNASLMKFLGYACDTVRDGTELMEVLKERTYAMVLLDIMMPGMDGFEATRRIRNGVFGEGNREAFIVAVTGCSDEEDKERAFNAGFNEYLIKPLTIDALRETINEYHALGKVI